MVIYLYALRYPSGQCVLLAKSLQQLTGRADSLQVAEELFDFQYRRENPVCMEVQNPAALDFLEALCTEFGIVVDVHEP